MGNWFLAVLFILFIVGVIFYADFRNGGKSLFYYTKMSNSHTTTKVHTEEERNCVEKQNCICAECQGELLLLPIEIEVNEYKCMYKCPYQHNVCAERGFYGNCKDCRLDGE